jgi:exonuclease VII small subunit
MPGEVNMAGTEEWFKAMGAAISKREHAENGVKRWQEKLAQAEQEIQELAAAGAAPTSAEPSTEQE